MEREPGVVGVAANPEECQRHAFNRAEMTKFVFDQSHVAFALVPVFFVVGASTMGCGDDEGANEPPSESFTAEQYCEAFFEALCERQIGCNTALVNQATSVESCIAEARIACDPNQVGWVASVAASLANFHSDTLVQCRSELSDLGCVELAAGARPASCGDVFTGPMSVGGECYTDIECAGDLRCATAGQCPGSCVEPAEPFGNFDCRLTGCPEGQYCEGNRCAPTLALGESCREADSCGPEAFCGKDVDEPELLCRALKTEGERCFFREDCSGDLGCRPDGSVGGNRQCLPAAPDGDFCADDDECAPGLICNADIMCSTPRGDEEPCDVGDCAEGLYCWTFNADGDSACRARSVVGIAEGELCNPIFDRCRLGLYCRADLPEEFGRCTLMPILGEGCADFGFNLNEECREGVCVDKAGDLVCAELQDEGGACTTGEECISRSCQAGACVPIAEISCQPT